ncbi:hypothetical protein [Colwellia echini]|uniref:Outer membrane protein beta-barrel domain-containing protein n=1 Tax=Colwellia echini TaxID=1982103 RepID=A0ABY3MYL9_9GAMM|nr:hypothetical protein [Colwellia echini]TYK66097.1 hypothetical protein CWS31_007465 [Colwellia echini]
MRVILTITCALSIVATPSIAKQPLNFEITPMIGYRFGGDFDNAQGSSIELEDGTSYGLVSAWSVDRKHQGEFLISYYDTNFSDLSNISTSDNELSITYAHLGGTVPISEGALPVNVVGGLGLTHFEPEDSEYSSETRFSINVGLASKIPLTESISFRVEGRAYATFFDSEGALFCGPNGCVGYISSNVWMQGEVNAGLTFKF